MNILFQYDLFFTKVFHVSGHGRLMDPPARNAMWRYGFPNPVNYNDNELYCGGFAGCSLHAIYSSTLLPNISKFSEYSSLAAKRWQMWRLWRSVAHATSTWNWRSVRQWPARSSVFTWASHRDQYWTFCQSSRILWAESLSAHRQCWKGEPGMFWQVTNINIYLETILFNRV